MQDGAQDLVLSFNVNCLLDVESNFIQFVVQQQQQQKEKVKH